MAQHYNGFLLVQLILCLTSLKQIDNEFEYVSSSLKQPFYKTFFRVTVPISLPAIFEIGIYFFVNAMTTVSAVVFLYSSKTNLASVVSKLQKSEIQGLQQSKTK